MPRIFFVLHRFNLADPGAEEELYDTRCLREFAGIDVGREPVPDETAIYKIRHLMEMRDLGDRLFQNVNAYLGEIYDGIMTFPMLEFSSQHLQYELFSAFADNSSDLLTTTLFRYDFFPGWSW